MSLRSPSREGPPPTQLRERKPPEDRRPSSSIGALERFFSNPWTETILGGLILLWVALAVIETTQRPVDPRLVRVSEFISVLFTIELALRVRIAVRMRRFLRE